MEKKFYVAPSVELIEVAVEAGFAASNEDPTDGGWQQSLIKFVEFLFFCTKKTLFYEKTFIICFSCCCIVQQLFY